MPALISPPYDSPATTLARRNRCTENDSMLGVFFRPALKLLADTAGLTHAAEIEREVTPKVLVPFLSYPMANFLTILYEVEKVLGSDQAGESMARAILEPYFGSPLGSMLFTLSRATPHDLIHAAVAGYKACYNRGEREYVRVGDREALMVFKDDLLGPAWHAHGIFPLAIMKACNIVATTTVEDADDLRMNFTVRTRW